MQEQSTHIEILRVRHPLKLRALTVATVTQLTPHMVRITLRGEDLADFHSESFDDHVKLMLPPPGVERVRFPPAGPSGRPDWEGSGLPQPIMRDYTPRRIDRARRELEIDFALHGSGPAAEWAAAAKPGDPVHIGGPRGSMVVPRDLQWQWLIGDDAALPAIARRLEELDDAVAVTVVIDTVDNGPLPPLRLDGARRLIRVCRAADGGIKGLADAVRSLDTPIGRGHAFAAAESRSVKAVRDVLAGHHGLSNTQIRASSYWRRGDSAHHENLDG